MSTHPMLAAPAPVPLDLQLETISELCQNAEALSGAAPECS
jgi:hypothetical protein